MRYTACLLALHWYACPHSPATIRTNSKSRQRPGWLTRSPSAGLRGLWGERAQLVRELEAAYPGKLPKIDPDKVAQGKAESEPEAWFELVSGGNSDVWRKSDASAAGLGQLYERCVQHLQLGPVPSIKKEEFLRFTRMMIANTASPTPVDPNVPNLGFDAEADKAFRILDQNSDGELTGSEISAGLKADKQADSSGDGRISKEEYRDYFKRRIEQNLSADYHLQSQSESAADLTGKPSNDRVTLAGCPRGSTSSTRTWTVRCRCSSGSRAVHGEWSSSTWTSTATGCSPKTSTRTPQKKKAEDATEKRCEQGRP